MAFQFGLNIKSKAPNGSKSSAPKKSVFDDEDDSDQEQSTGQEPLNGQEITAFDGTSRSPDVDDLPRTESKPSKEIKEPPTFKKKQHDESQYGDISSSRLASKHAQDAIDLDPSINDYDAFHEAHSQVKEARKAAERQDALERKPRYINNLLDAAARRKQDQLVAREKFLQKEREAEGDKFADKEKFVTTAYKAQQEETRKIEEEEKRIKEEEERRKKETGGGMKTFYKGLMDEEEKRNREAMEALAKSDKTAREEQSQDQDKTDAELVEEMRAKGVNVHVNDEGQVTDRRQLLTAGLNVAPSGRPDRAGKTSGADHLRTKPKEQQDYKRRDRQDIQREQRERQTRMIEEQLEQQAKRAADEEAEEQREREHAAKSRKTEGELSSARERFLARKKEREAAAKGG